MYSLKFKFSKNSEISSKVKVEKNDNGKPKDVPASPEKLEMEFNSDDYFKIWVDGNVQPPNNKWKIDFDDTLPQTVNVTMGEN